MATTLSLTETYDGKRAGDIIFAAMQALDSLQYLTVRPNIEWKEKVVRLVDNVSLTAMACDFTPTGTTTLTERTLQLLGLGADREYCTTAFLEDWSAAYAQDNELDPVIENGIADNLLAGAMAALETMIWQGVPGANSFEGFVGLLIADATVNDVATPVAIDATNVLAKIVLLLAALPAAVKNGTEKPIIYMSPDVWDDYVQAQIAAGNGWYATAGPEVPKRYLGTYDIVVPAGMPVDTMIFAKKSNLWFGTWKEAQLNNIAIVNMYPTTLDKKVRMQIGFFAGVQYGFGNEIAMYTTTTDS